MNRVSYVLDNKINKENMFIIDSTGFNITDRGEWMNEKYNKKRKGWIKVHLAIDAWFGPF
jgi:hypothetical protein